MNSYKQTIIFFRIEKDLLLLKIKICYYSIRNYNEFTLEEYKEDIFLWQIRKFHIKFI